MEFPQKILDQIRELHKTAKVEAQRLKAEAEQAAKTERIWEEFEQFLAKGWALHVLALIEKEELLRKMRAEHNSVNLDIEEIKRIAEEESERILRRYPALLERACSNNGLILDSNSPHPKYSLEKGFFRLEIDEKKRMARFFDHEGKLAELPADIQAVVETIQREYQRVFGRPFNGPKFLRVLRKQYTAILKREKQSDGASVPIRQITKRLGKNVKGFRTDEFLVDLSRLAEKGPLEIDGRRLELQQTKDTNKGMLLYGPAGRGYIGFIVFKEV